MRSSINSLNNSDFRSSPIYRTTAPTADIQRELVNIANFYQGIERNYNYSTVALIICTAVPLVVLFALPVLHELGWLMIVGFLLAGVYAGTLRHQARQWHFPRDRDRLFSEVLDLLKRDMAEQEPLDIKFCLGQVEQTGQALQKQSVPEPPAHQQEDWRNPWFAIQGCFLDGNVFHLQLVERVLLTRKLETPSPPSKASSSASNSNCDGFDLTLQLHVDPTHYGSLAPLASHLADAVKLLPGAKLTKHDMTEQEMTLVVLLPPTFTASLMYQSITLLFLSAYHLLHLAAQLAAQLPEPLLTEDPTDPATPPLVSGPANTVVNAQSYLPGDETVGNSGPQPFMGGLNS